MDKSVTFTRSERRSLVSASHHFFVLGGSLGWHLGEMVGVVVLEQCGWADRG